MEGIYRFCCLFPLLFFFVNGQYFECHVNELMYELNVKKVNSVNDYSQVLGTCGQNIEIWFITFEDCFVGKIELDINDIKRSFKSVKIVSWRCNGFCTYIGQNDVQILGCEGMYCFF